MGKHTHVLLTCYNWRSFIFIIESVSENIKSPPNGRVRTFLWHKEHQSPTKLTVILRSKATSLFERERLK